MIPFKKDFLMTMALAFCLLFSACGKEKDGGLPENAGGGNTENAENTGSAGNTEDTETTVGQGGNQPDANGVGQTVSFQPDQAVLQCDAKAFVLLCAGEDGTFYTFDRKEKKFFGYGADGKGKEEYPIQEKDLYAASYRDGTIYYISGNELYALELGTGISKMLYTFDGDMFMFGRMVALEDSVFFIRKGLYKDEWADLYYAEEYGYTYEGEELFCFHPSTGEMEGIDIQNIKRIARKNDRELLVYAYDDEGGFYFSVYHTDKTMGEARYPGINFGQVNDIAYDEGLGKVVCEDFSGVFLTDMDDFSGKAYAYESTPVGYQIFSCADGFTYEMFDKNGKDVLIRLENRRLVRDVPSLKGYTLSRYFEPKRHGYPLNCEEIAEDQIALVLMANDTDYDFLVLDSSFQIARNVRSLSAYYPLNSLSGLDAFFAECHAYVREGATAENGDVWMLPLEVECPVLFYNEDMLERYNIALSELSDYTQLIDRTIKLPDDGSVLYDIPYLLMMLDVENQYLENFAIKGGKADFHQEIFRTYLENRRLLERRAINKLSTLSSRKKYPYVMSQDEYFKNMLYAMERSPVGERGAWLRYDRYDFIRVLPAPGIQAGEKLKNQALVRMIVVNPNSEKKDEMFDYLNEVCDGIRENPYSLMLAANDFSGKPLWQEMQAIVADAEIYFKYPYEIVSDEVWDYVNGKKSYEDTVGEMERKMNMYLNE